MKIRLVPVVEIYGDNAGLVAPAEHPAWAHPGPLDAYHEQRLRNAGYEPGLKPWLGGTSFYDLAEIAEPNLERLVLVHTKGLRTGEYTLDQCCGLSGGFVLQVDGIDKFFPQCCGELSDIIYWERLSEGVESYCEGHPAPYVFVQGDQVKMDFTVEESDESFQPTPPETILLLDRKALAGAVA
ncbi:MAG: hypothetical protein EOP49_32625, partial [Sphingobacteriales bacterium]